MYFFKFVSGDLKILAIESQLKSRLDLKRLANKSKSQVDLKRLAIPTWDSGLDLRLSYRNLRLDLILNVRVANSSVEHSNGEYFYRE